jgi:signal transduction histidine kinase
MDDLSLSFSSFAGPATAAPDDDPFAPDGKEEGRAVYLVGRQDGRAGSLRPRLEAYGPVPVEPGGMAAHADGTPGLVILVAADLTVAQLLADLRSVAQGRGEWLPVVLEEGDCGELGVRPLSLGYAHEIEETVAANTPDPDRPLVLEFRRILDEISHARHDLNNPLTSALAETQLLLMDITEGEAKESLEVVQRQLRRMRDMIRELSPLRFSDA